MAYDGKVVIGTKLDNSGFTNGVSGLKSSLKGIAAAVGLAFSAAAVINFGKASVKAAAEMSNALTGLQSIMEGQGRSFSQAQKFINAYVSDGLIPATQAITAYKNLALRGYDDTQIQQVMTALKDSAAFGRQASYSLGEAVAGATEGLKNENSILVDNAGITKNVSMMWKDYAKSIGVGVDSLTQQQKIQAEVTGIMQETRFQTGDAAKVAETYSGQVLKLGFSFNNLKIAVGNALIPLAQAVLPGINAILTGLTKVVNLFSQVSAAIFGTQAKQQQAVATAASGAAAAEEKLAGSTKKAGKAAKGALTAFDELNVLQKDAGGDSEGVAAGGAGEMAVPVVDTTETEGALSEAAQRMLGILAPLREISLDHLAGAFGRLTEAIKPLGKKLFDGLSWAYKNLFVPLAQWAVEDALPAFFDALAGALEYFNGVLEVLKPLGIWLWENFLQPLAAWTGGAVVEVLGKIRTIYSEAAQWIAANKEKMLGIFEAITPLVQSVTAGIIRVFDNLKALFFSIWGAVIQVLQGILDFVVGVFTGDWAQAWEGIKAIFSGIIDAFMAILQFFWGMLVNGFQTGWENIKLIWSVVAAWFNVAVIQPIARFFAGMWDSIKKLASDCWQAMKGCWVVVSGWFCTTVIQPVQQFFTDLWSTVKNLALWAWTGISGVWTIVSAWFMNHVVTPISTFFADMWKGITKAFTDAWDGMTKGFKGYINGWLSMVEGFANFFVSMINHIIDALNSISVDIPDKKIFGDLAGMTFGFNIDNIPNIKLPRLAQGAVIPANREFMAVLGDQRRGQNIEAPADLIRKIIREESGSREIVIRFEGSMAQLVRVLGPALEAETARQGTRLVMGGI